MNVVSLLFSYDDDVFDDDDGGEFPSRPLLDALFARLPSHSSARSLARCPSPSHPHRASRARRQ